MKQFFKETIKIIAIIAIAIPTLAFLAGSWNEPIQSPPGTNVNAPLNVGNIAQFKEGGLMLNTLGAVVGLIVDKGDVGIGTASPQAKLDVAGKIKVGDDSVSPTAGTIRWTGSDLEVYDGSAWKSLTSGDTTIITPDVTDCNNNGGNWVDAQGVCYLPVAGGCPSGWTQKESYSTTQSNTCNGCGQPSWSGKFCSTGSHFRINKGVESCRYRKEIPLKGRGGEAECQWNLNANCYAPQTEVGCVKTE